MPDGRRIRQASLPSVAERTRGSFEMTAQEEKFM